MRALRFVDEIAGSIAKDNHTRATSFVLELQDSVTTLQAHPGMGSAGGRGFALTTDGLVDSLPVALPRYIYGNASCAGLKGLQRAIHRKTR